jgi:hypothetical protein
MITFVLTFVLRYRKRHVSTQLSSEAAELTRQFEWALTES